MKRYLVLDIEVFKRFFCVCIKDFKTGERYYFEISRRRNDLENLIAFVFKDPENTYIFTCNGNRYDNVILNFLRKKLAVFRKMSHKEINPIIKMVSDEIIQNTNENGLNKYSSFGWGLSFNSVDFQAFYAISTVKSKNLSLKFFSFNLGLKIEECPVHWNKDELTDKEMDLIASYCWTDTDNTDYVIENEKREDVNFRFELRKEYGFDCLSWSDVKIGEEGLLHDMAKENNVHVDELRNKRTFRSHVNLKNIINPDIKFQVPATGKHWKERIKKGKTKDAEVVMDCFETFNDLLNFLKRKTVKSLKEINCRVYYEGTLYDVKSGGLHSYHEPIIYKTPEGYFMEDIDVDSYYPSLGCEHGYVPKQFKPYKLADILRTQKKERVADKKAGRIRKANFKKLKLNGGFFGKTSEPNSDMNDWQCTLQITLNGQLGLLMKSEMATLIEGVQVLMCNTDGITVIVPNSKEQEWYASCRKWEQIMKCTWEHVRYSKIVCRNINNYIAFYADPAKAPKLKGFFDIAPSIDKSRNFLVIPKAVREYFINGTPVEDFIRKHDNFFDFCAGVKQSRKFSVHFKGEQVQQLNRYYASNSGSYLVKNEKAKDKYSSIQALAGHKVKLYNDDIRGMKVSKELDINYQYYINKAKEVIAEFSTTDDYQKSKTIHNQINLF